MAATLTFELVDPERVLASEPVEMVVLPGVEGDFGVLPDHAPLVSLLRPGVIAVYEGTKVTRRIFVAGGFAEVNEQGCVVLAEGAQMVDELDRAAVEQALKDAEEDLADAKEPSEEERARLERAVAIARARLEAVTAKE
ncbi:MAG: ATP synthase epsilon chain [Geminicoccaceae bacterium]|jgi:F-type H+-transporting ATPase subunit epsilon|nr:MAG: ATP synthase epsilon chain [Geminicoccaceae bacterium]